MTTKKSKAYWVGRFDQVEQSGHDISLKHTKQLEKKYKIAAKEIDTKINAWYNRIAKNNNVSVAEARKLLTKSELAEFKWDVEEYIKRGQENAFDQRWMKELENASAKFHINRLEALKLEVRQQIEQAFAGGQQSMFDTLADVYKDSFYRTCYEVQKGFGVGFDVSRLDNKQVQTLLNKPWSVDGVNFSQKIWNNKVKLINTLDQEMSKMVLTGSTPQKAIQSIKKSMDTSLFNAKRLVLTEQAYFTTIGQKDAFGELDVEEFEVVATLDSRTSEICQGMDGKHFPVKDMQAGVNAPPFHPFCRSTTCPYFDDEFSLEDKRVAKDEETGEWYEIPANMTYPEWKKAFVDGGSKDSLERVQQDAQMMNDEDMLEKTVKNDRIYASNKEMKAKDLSEEMQKTLYNYTNGKYGAICDYSQYIVDENALNHNVEWFKKNRLPEISEKDRQDAMKIMDIIQHQPVSDITLHRIEGYAFKGEVGDILNFGIRSTSRDKDFATKVFDNSVEGFDEIKNNGQWTEYVFEYSKQLDIADVSAYKDQEESIICGKYKVVKVEEIEAKQGGLVDVKRPIKESFEEKGIKIERFTSKKGNEMVRYTEDGVEKTMTLEKYETGEVTEFITQKAQFGRKKVYLEYVDDVAEEVVEKPVKSSTIEIDELTPCLRRLSDGKIVNTSVVDIVPTKEEFKDWEFDWTVPQKKGYAVRAIKADGDDRIQGMVALKSDPQNYAVEVDIVEAAPFNNPHNKAYNEKEYAGIGGHLFAEAVKESMAQGYDGFVYFKAKTDLVEHYQKELGAVLINPKERIMAIDERSAKALYDKYYKVK